MIAEVLRTIRRERMLESGEPVWVAVSGGVDSMVLLYVLRELGHPCQVAHVDHGLRGAESEADRHFVEEQAKLLGLPFRSVRVNPKAAAEGISIQMAARELRYSRFKELLREGPANIALGHHRDDVVETLMLNLLRGIGAHGWSGIPPVTKLEEGRICRPMLAVDRERISAYASANNIPFREDASNTDPHYLRNRVRADLLPLMEAMRPGARRTLARGTHLLDELAKAAEQQLAREAQELTAHADGVLHIPFEKLTESVAPRLLLMRLLKGLDPHPDLIDQLLEAVHERATGARFHAGDRHISVERKRLVVDGPRDGFPTFAVSASQAESGSSDFFSWKIRDVSGVDLGQGMNTAWLDLDLLEFPLQLRPWQTGDRMRPVGLGGSKLISDILIDAGIPRNTKAATYVLESGGTIVWLVGHRIAEGYSPGNNTKNVFSMSFRQEQDHHP